MINICMFQKKLYLFNFKIVKYKIQKNNIFFPYHIIVIRLLFHHVVHLIKKKSDSTNTKGLQNERGPYRQMLVERIML